MTNHTSDADLRDDAFKWIFEYGQYGYDHFFRHTDGNLRPCIFTIRSKVCFISEQAC